MLRFIARHSTLIMPLSAVVGFISPELSSMVLAYLLEVLFFLMFFTLLGIDQYALFKCIVSQYVWVFAVLQSAGLTLLLVAVAYLIGAW